MMRWLVQYLADFWFCRRLGSCQLGVRVDHKDGTYMWFNGKDGKDALKQLLPQIESKYKRARFGAIYVPDRDLAMEIQKALRHDCGFLVRRYSHLLNADLILAP